MTKAEIIEKVHALINAGSCCAELKEKAQAYLDAQGTDTAVEAAKALVEEAKEDMIPIDGLIAFAGSERGAEIFGKERAEATLKAAQEAKAGGETICICDACQAAKAIVEHADLL